MDEIDSIDPTLLGTQLTLARKARGLTQQQAAEVLGVSRTTVTAIEKGERRPRPKELVQLADLYGRQLHDLLHVWPGTSAPGFIVHFRSARRNNASSQTDARDEDIWSFERLCSRYVELERITGSPLARRYPDVYDIRGSDPERAAEEVASTERNRLGLGDGSIGDLWGVLEADIGLRVFARAFHDDGVAGLFIYTEEFGGCIAVNVKHPEDRRRWTAAHEYGHFLTDRYRAEVTVLPNYRRVPESERFADAFAARFLMPETGLVRNFEAMKRSKDRPVAPADILILAHRYRVSFAAMIIRLEDLKLVRTGSWATLRANGFKADAAKALVSLPVSPRELKPLPLRFEALAVEAYDRGLISEGILADYLETDRIGARERVTDLKDEFHYEGGWMQTPLDFQLELTNALH